MSTTAMIYDAIILGAGGAGMMCAATAGQRGKKVLLIDHADQPGKKILISGGGRCNFTNIHTGPQNFICKNPHFAKSALARYTPDDFVKLVDGYGIAWHEKTLGQLFCDGSAKQVVEMLLAECRKGEVKLKLGEPIETAKKSGDVFTVVTNAGSYKAKALVMATGGPSIPKMGATGFAYELARQFGLKIIEPKPALVPLTLGVDEALFKSLSGVSADVIASCNGTGFREAALFTHKGLSGPAILQISSYWKHGNPVKINFLPGHDRNWLVDLKKASPHKNTASAISDALPGRLATALMERLPAFSGSRELGNCPDLTLQEIAGQLASFPFSPNGTEGFAKAEVTIGGISTDELSSKTFEARKVPGLYAIGEALDVTGWLGGYNFQWAWASGWCTGKALSTTTDKRYP